MICQTQADANSTISVGSGQKERVGSSLAKKEAKIMTRVVSNQLSVHPDSELESF